VETWKWRQGQIKAGKFEVVLDGIDEDDDLRHRTTVCRSKCFRPNTTTIWRWPVGRIQHDRQTQFHQCWRRWRKTFRLTQILTSSSSGAVRPSGVIATTFTKKAATELRERVRSHLLKQGEYGLANAMGQARIGTVNSVCGGLLIALF
jgi:hypothetical protein